MRRLDGMPSGIGALGFYALRFECEPPSPVSARSIAFIIQDSPELSKIFTTEVILFTMAPFCGRSDSNMDRQRHSVPWNHENGEGIVGSGTGFIHDLTDRGSPSSFG